MKLLGDLFNFCTRRVTRTSGQISTITYYEIGVICQNKF